jgi:hypothetical protein
MYRGRNGDLSAAENGKDAVLREFANFVFARCNNRSYCKQQQRISFKFEDFPMTDKIKMVLMMTKRGCAVLPLVEGGKTPAVEKGVHAASKDLALIKKHFGKHREHNWGIARHGRDP